MAVEKAKSEQLEDTNTSILSLMSTSKLPYVEGIELSEISSAEPVSGEFQTWYETSFGLLAVVGKVSNCTDDEKKLYVPLIVGALGVSATNSEIADPTEILCNLNKYLNSQEPITCSVSISLAMWDASEQLLCVTNAGSALVAVFTSEGSMTLDSMNPELGTDLKILEPPKILDIGISECLVLDQKLIRRLGKDELKNIELLSANQISETLATDIGFTSGLILKKIITL